MQVYVVVNKKNSRVAGVYASFSTLMADFAPPENGTLRIDFQAAGAIFYREFESFEATLQEVIE